MTSDYHSRKPTLANLLKAEFVSGRTPFDWAFLALGISVQIVVFCIKPGNPWAIVSGICGIISVILCSQGKISTFLFGFIQIATYLYLSLIQRLYAEVGINVFYLLSQLYGIYVWSRHYRIKEDNHSAELQPKHMSVKLFALIAFAAIILSILVGFLLARFTDDSQPWLDAFTTVPAIFAQILMILTYREQWFLWILVDVLSSLMWARAGEWCLFAQYIFWLANCVYGYRKWTMKLS